MRISDWSSDVCSSDLMNLAAGFAVACALGAYGAFAVQSVVLAVIDARMHRLPDRYVLPGYPIAAVLLTFSALASGTAERRSEERRVGTECVSPCRYRGSTHH